MRKTGKLVILKLLEILCLLQLDFPIMSAQVEVETCARYKKEMFETEFTYGVFTYGGQEMKTVVDKCKHYDPFVVGGVPALPREFPPMARLGHAENKRKTNWFCGGTLISDRYVLTAAHCFYSPDGEVNRVRLGELDFSQNDEEADPEDFGVKQTIDHPDYNEDFSLYNDIGLIELDRAVKLNSFKHPACLPISSGDEISEFIATGWGSTRFASAPSETLQKVKLDRFTENQCQRLAIGIGPEKLATGLSVSSQLCAGSSSIKDTCNGDSGGPLFAYHQQYPCMYYVMGVTSAGIEGCGRPNIPGIYTRVYYYMDWIKSYVHA